MSAPQSASISLSHTVVDSTALVPVIGPDKEKIDISDVTRSLQSLAGIAASKTQNLEQSVTKEIESVINREKIIAEDIAKRTPAAVMKSVSLEKNVSNSNDLSAVALEIDSYLQELSDFNAALKAQIVKNERASISSQLAIATRLAMELGAAAEGRTLSPHSNYIKSSDPNGKNLFANVQNDVSSEILKSVNTAQGDVSWHEHDSQADNAPGSINNDKAGSVELNALPDSDNLNLLSEKQSQKNSKEQKIDGFMQAQAMASSLLLEQGDETDASSSCNNDRDDVAAQTCCGHDKGNDANRGGADSSDSAQRAGRGDIKTKQDADLNNGDKGTADILTARQGYHETNSTIQSNEPDNACSLGERVKADSTDNASVLSCEGTYLLSDNVILSNGDGLNTDDCRYSADADKSKANGNPVQKPNSLDNKSPQGKVAFDLSFYKPRRHAKAVEYIQKQKELLDMVPEGIELLGADDEESFESILLQARKDIKESGSDVIYSSDILKVQNTESEKAYQGHTHLTESLNLKKDNVHDLLSDSSLKENMSDAKKDGSALHETGSEGGQINHIAEDRAAFDISDSSCGDTKITEQDQKNSKIVNNTVQDIASYKSVTITQTEKNSPYNAGTDTDRGDAALDNVINNVMSDESFEDIHSADFLSEDIDESDDDYLESLETDLTYFDFESAQAESDIDLQDKRDDNAIHDGNPVYVSPDKRELIEQSTTHAMVFADRDLKTPDDFYDRVYEYDNWYRDIVKAGFKSGPDFALLTESVRLVDQDNNLHWTLQIHSKYSLMTQDPNWVHNITTRFAAFVVAGLKIDIKLIDYIPEKCPYNFALGEYLNAVSSIRKELGEGAVNELLVLLKEDVNALQIDIYKRRKLS